MTATSKHWFSSIFPVAACIGVAHVIVGTAIIIEPQAILVSAFAGLRWISAVYSPGEILGGLLLIVAGVMSVVGGAWPGLQDYTRLRLIGPQVILLVFTLASVIPTIIEGRYPDGYQPSGGTAFILADQGIAVCISLFHIISILMMRPVDHRIAWR